MALAIIITFILGYFAIALEHSIKINKAASALVTGVVCWTIYILCNADKHHVTEQLMEQLGEVSGILFFLLGAMTIVELIDAHDGFEVITDRIKTKSAVKLLWIIATITFFLSAILDNLTTAIVMVSLLRKLIADKEQRLFFVGITVIAANAGGAWSPLGDVTTTMLWIGGQVSALNIMKGLFVPSLFCLAIPLITVSFRMKGTIEPIVKNKDEVLKPAFERNFVFLLGVGIIIFVPIFKTLTHLPPFMAILLGLGLMWIITEILHNQKDAADKDSLTVVYALRKIDTPSILFFLGILISISALQATGQLTQLAQWLTKTIGNDTIIVTAIGFAFICSRQCPTGCSFPRHVRSGAIPDRPFLLGVSGLCNRHRWKCPDHWFSSRCGCNGNGKDQFFLVPETYQLACSARIFFGHRDLSAAILVDTLGLMQLAI
jgi:Na+/H+ antiporter NhaD/arsenite permease-like protein